MCVHYNALYVYCLYVTAAEQAQRVVKIKMNFPSSVFCNNAGKNVLDKRIREALQKLNKNWNFCINTVEGRCPNWGRTGVGGGMV